MKTKVFFIVTLVCLFWTNLFGVWWSYFVSDEEFWTMVQEQPETQVFSAICEFDSNREKDLQYWDSALPESLENPDYSTTIEWKNGSYGVFQILYDQGKTEVSYTKSGVQDPSYHSPMIGEVEWVYIGVQQTHLPARKFVVDPSFQVQELMFQDPGIGDFYAVKFPVDQVLGSIWWADFKMELQSSENPKIFDPEGARLYVIGVGTPVPEPSFYALLFAVSVILMTEVRRRQSVFNRPIC